MIEQSFQSIFKLVPVCLVDALDPGLGLGHELVVVRLLLRGLLLDLRGQCVLGVGHLQGLPLLLEVVHHARNGDPEEAGKENHGIKMDGFGKEEKG